MTAVYHYGASVFPSDAGNHFTWVDGDNTIDYSQPFIASGTTMSRIKVPLQPNGNGADILISLYPDNGSGSPNTSSAPLAATRVTAAYLNQVCASNGLENATSNLQTTQNNSYFCTDGFTVNSTWSGAGNYTGTSFASNNGWGVWVGGQLTSGGSYNQVNSVQYVGGTNALSAPISQPTLPFSSTNGGTVMLNNVIVYGGGMTNNASQASVISSVAAASWDPSTGVIGSWSAQQNLPVALNYPGCAGWNDTSSIYFVGGLNSSNTLLTTVYWATVQSSGQLTTWNVATPLPTAVANPFVACIAGWIIVAGGANGSTLPDGGGNMYYAKINSDGSLSSWQTGASLSYSMTPLSQGSNYCVLDNALITMGGSDNTGTSSNIMQVLTVTEANGPASAWTISILDQAYETVFMPVSLGVGGTWATIGMFPETGGAQGIYHISTYTPVPMVQVPLTTTSMTNGNKYHLVIQQNQTYSESDYVAVGTIESTGGASITALSSTRHSGTWSNLSSGYEIPIYFYGVTTISNENPQLWFVNQDVDPVTNVTRRWSSLLYTYNGLLYGALESTEMPNLALNANPTFTTNVSNWGVVNGTFTQSNAQTHGGFPFSGLLTPTGGFSQAYVSSNLFNIYPGSKPVVNNLAPWINAQGWFYSPTGWANFSLNINWFDSTGTYMSTTVGSTVSLAAATWTFVSTFGQPPLGAATGAVVPTESSSPGATNTLFCSNVFGMYSPEYGTALTSAAQVEYGTAQWPPIGVTQLL